MSNSDLAEIIRMRFTPYAFLCECQGTQPECHQTRTTDTYAIAANETIERIATFIEDYYQEGGE